MWVKCFDFVPYFRNETDGVKKSEDYKPYRFDSEAAALTVLAALNSSAFFYYFVALGDCFHCGKEFVTTFPFAAEELDAESQRQLGTIAERLMKQLRKTAIRRKAYSEKTGAIEYDEFWPRYSKTVIDEIDRVLAKHYGFTDEELDFIINYDIKYRMGGSDNDGDE